MRISKELEEKATKITNEFLEAFEEFSNIVRGYICSYPYDERDR